MKLDTISFVITQKFYAASRIDEALALSQSYTRGNIIIFKIFILVDVLQTNRV